MSIELGIVCIGAAIAISISFAFAAWFERSKTKKEWVDDWLKIVFSCFSSPVTLCSLGIFVLERSAACVRVLTRSGLELFVHVNAPSQVGWRCRAHLQWARNDKKKPALMPAEWWGYPQFSRRVQFLQGFSTKADRMQWLRFSTSLWRVARVMPFGLLRSEWCKRVLRSIGGLFLLRSRSDRFRISIRGVASGLNWSPTKWAELLRFLSRIGVGPFHSRLLGRCCSQSRPR